MIVVSAVPDWGWPPKWITGRISDFLLGKLVCAVVILIAGGAIAGLAALVTGTYRAVLVALAVLVVLIATAPLLCEHLRRY